MAGDGVLSESKVSTTPDDPSRAVVAGVAALLEELDLNPAARRGGAARHHRRLQHPPPTLRRPDRSHHHPRLSRRAGDRPHPHARHVRPDVGQAQAAGPAPPSPGGGRAHRRRRQRGRAARRGERRRRRPAALGGRHRVRRRLPHQQLPQPRPRAAHRGDPARALPAPAGLRLLGRAARAQGIRAHQHHGRQRLPALGHARLSAEPGKRARLHRHRGADPRHHLQRRHARGLQRRRQAGVRGRIGPCRRRDRRNAPGRCPQGKATSSSSTWAAPPPRP